MIKMIKVDFIFIIFTISFIQSVNIDLLVSYKITTMN